MVATSADLEFTYLGSKLSDDNRIKAELRAADSGCDKQQRKSCVCFIGGQEKKGIFRCGKTGTPVSVLILV